MRLVSNITLILHVNHGNKKDKKAHFKSNLLSLYLHLFALTCSFKSWQDGDSTTSMDNPPQSSSYHQKADDCLI